MLDKYSLPIKFEQIVNVLDDRFMRVKIWIAHTGENRNRSIFTKEVLTAMIPSLSNTMILGYIVTNDNGEQDFKGHEEKLVIEDGEFKFKYMGRAWGLIPESNNAHFEFRYGDDGVEREYLVTEGVLWRKFPEVEKIFDRDGGFKSQSMELFPPSVDGYVDENGLFVFTKAKVEGATILGEGVTPAIISSTIEKFSVANNIKAEFSEMLTEFNTHFTLTQQKGDDPVDKDKVLEPIDNPEVTPVEPVVEPTPQPEPEVVEPVTEFQAEPTPETVDPEPTPEPVIEADPAVTPQPDQPEKFTVTRTFELAQDDVRRKIYDNIDSYMSGKGFDSYFYIAQVFQTYFVVSDDYSDKYYKIGYEITNDNLSYGAVEEVFPMFVNQAEKSAIDISRTNFTVLEQEVTTLRDFKAGIELAEKEQKLTSYTSILSEDEFKTIKENLVNFSMVDIEKEIGFMLLKKNHFSADKQEDHTSRVAFVPAEENFKYGTLSKYFTK
jgi:hypothetical protein